MGKVTLGQWTQKDEQFTRTLKAELGKMGKDYKNLMRRTGRSQSNIHRKYREPDMITVGDLRGFIQESGLSPRDVLDFLYTGKGEKWERFLTQVTSLEHQFLS